MKLMDRTNLQRNIENLHTLLIVILAKRYCCTNWTLVSEKVYILNTLSYSNQISYLAKSNTTCFLIKLKPIKGFLVHISIYVTDKEIII